MRFESAGIHSRRRRQLEKNTLFDFRGRRTGGPRAGLAMDFTTPTIDFTNDTWSLGWEFNVLNPVTVTALGFYDDLGIFDSIGTLLGIRHGCAGRSADELVPDGGSPPEWVTASRRPRARRTIPST
jgi:hypothetical protein